ncbi:MAG: hypothetical protein Edafosvirus2_66 [Edafosvirus sp.]|uniref:DUF6891 domain-containing protein n=1 Tax=Edafosvirus sp. TaxID=2487765 RepID=A0A3G4ZSL7_9VIRU|nr:MAG: hypothetical protein Edafosvirus2_66 [Edafosvirus sp.]
MENKQIDLWSVANDKYRYFTDIFKTMDEKQRKRANKIGSKFYNYMIRLAYFFENLPFDIYVRENYTCCMSCGHNEIDQDAYEVYGEELKDFKGYIFYHSQNFDDILTTFENITKKYMKLYLCYGYFGKNDNAKEIDKIYKYIANVLKKACEQYGMSFVWNGDHKTKMCLVMEIDKIEDDIIN